MWRKILGAVLLLCTLTLIYLGTIRYLHARDTPTNEKAVATLEHLRDDCTHQRYRSLTHYLSPHGNLPYPERDEDDAEFRRAVTAVCTGISGHWRLEQIAPFHAGFVFDDTKRLVYMSWNKEKHRFLIHTDSTTPQTTG